jgi:ABC-2 type transport system ATP-binding protein
MILKIENLTKNYGSFKALDNINLELKEGMYGLLGPNGAGKTTLLRILATLLQKSGGTISLDGIDIQKKKDIRSQLGYLPQEFSFYPEMTVLECMDYLALLSGIRSSRERRSKTTDLLERVNLTEHKNKKCKSLSGGMKRRLGIAQAILNDPKLLIVDEPTSGLDPEERIKFRNLISEFSEKRIVILSTHIVEDIEATCDKLAVINKGQIIFKGSVEELIYKVQGKVWTSVFRRSEFEDIKESSTIISSISEGKNIRARILSDLKPAEGAENVLPSIEDAYLQLMKSGEKN